MASITYWNRVEPRPRSKSLGHALSARIRDPLWFLARQWQFGEFQGEDAGSPAYIQFSANFSKIEQWHSPNDEAFAVDSKKPLEAQIQTEAFSETDFTITVELGQQFKAFLEKSISDIDDFRTVLDETLTQYAVPKPEDIDPANRDKALMSFLRVFAGNEINGTKLLRDYLASAPEIPSDLTIPDPLKNPYKTGLVNLKQWAESTYGKLGKEDSPAWVPERLEYGLSVTASSPAGEQVKLNVYPGQNGEFDWYDFDHIPSEEDTDNPPGEDAETVIHSILPAYVRFPGMPNARWWQFERGDINLSDVKVDPSDTAKMALLDFGLIHSNDWFVIPVAQPVGSLGRLNALLVHDVFGGVTEINPAVTDATNVIHRWSMFTTSIVGSTSTTDYFVLPPGPGTLDIQSESTEEVRFLRDEMFNSAFGVEHITQNGLGERWFGHERAMPKPSDYEKNTTTSPLKYLLQSWLPENWIPFVPVRQGDTTAAVDFERALILQPDHLGNLATVKPHGRILNPTNLRDPAIYRIREEEIPRTGVRVSRLVRRTRWLNGETYIWIARTVKPGSGEGSSGLRYDLAIPLDNQ